MHTDTPHGWLARAAEVDPEAPALIFGEGVVSYADLDHQVNLRGRSLTQDTSSGSIVPVHVRLDVASVVELLALMRSGRVPLPYAGAYPDVQDPPPQGTAVCIATSGSQGAARIVPLSHENLAASARASRSRLGNQSKDRWLATLPLHHIGGMSVILRTLEAGGSAVVAPFDRSIGSILESNQPTFASLVPTMVHRLLRSSPQDLASIGIVLTGGAKLGVGLRRRAEELDVNLVPTYGMTETSSQIATGIPGKRQEMGDDVGLPLDGFSVSIRTGADGTKPGAVGVIEVDGPAVFAGYLGEAVRRGPFATSDIGSLTDDGLLRVLGRIDDVVVTGGENVSLSAVSSAIEDVPGVVDVAVVGVADAEWGIAICALVDILHGASEPDVIDGISDVLMSYAIPKQIRFGAIPLLDNGKHNKRVVRHRFESM